MKKYSTLFAFAMFALVFLNAPNKLHAQTSSVFEIVTCDSLIKVATPSDLDDANVSCPDIKNISTKTINTKLKIFVDSLTEGHTFSVCFKSCYAPFTETWICPDVVSLAAEKKISASIGSSKVAFDLNHNMGIGVSKFRVRFYDADNEQNYIEYPIVYKVGVSGVNDNGSNSDVAVYPNPAQNSVSLTFNGFQAVKVQLFDMIGNKVSDNSVNGMEKASIDVTSMNAGSYIAVISDIYGRSIKRNVSIVK